MSIEIDPLLLPEPAKPGEETQRLRREIGELVRERERLFPPTPTDEPVMPTPKKVKPLGIPPWLIPGTREWEVQVKIHSVNGTDGVREMMGRRQAWFKRREAGEDLHGG